jgi:hypothetical protein
MTDCDDHIQRALNEAKRQELREKYGAEFHSGDCSLPPDIEGRWLSEIEEFERQFESSEQISIRRFVGNPPITPLGNVPQEELRGKLEHLLEILGSNNIQVSFPEDVSDAEAYRFLTEEILSQEVADIRIEGLTLNFLYEEFHPDLVKDASWTAEDFLQALFERKEEVVMHLLSSKESFDQQGAYQPPDSLRSEVFTFLGDIAMFLDWDVEVTRCTVAAGEASVYASVFWTGLNVESLRKVSACGRAEVHLKHLDDCWRIVRVSVPGMLPSSE